MLYLLRLLSVASAIASSGAVRLSKTAGLVDVTDIVDRPSFSKHGFQCCCDKRKGLKDDWRGTKPSGVCAVSRSDKCGHVKVVPTTTKAHNYKETDGKCEIPESGIEEFFKSHGSPLKYCRATTMRNEAGEFKIDESSLGQARPYSCPKGWRALTSHVTCVFESSTAGRFTQPECEKKFVATTIVAPVALTKDLPADSISAPVGKVDTRGGGPHKCSIQWEVPNRGVAFVSFPVSSCKIQCKRTFTDFDYDKMFPAAFEVEQYGRSCVCNHRGGGSVLKFLGACDENAKKKCFSDYKVLRTDSYTRVFDKETTVVVHNYHLYHEKKFDYTKCEENACPGGECVESEFPSIIEGRGWEEMQAIAEMLKKVAHGKGDDLKGDDKMIVDALTNDDIGDIMFSDILMSLTDSSTDGYVALTVGKLREIYEVRLKGTAISVDHLLKIAGLTDDDMIVDRAAFKRFLNPDCED